MTTAPGETLPRGRAAQPGAIVLARHGRPRCDRRTPIDWRAYEKWWEQYDLAGLDDDQEPPGGLIAATAASDIIYASTLRRALETAQAVAGGRPILQDEVFVEAPLPPPPVWGKWSPRMWGVFARVAWWLGRHGDKETKAEAEQRAEAAAATVAARALRGENVILFAHGWFNRMMRRSLKRHGWTEVENHGDAYWAYRRFERRK